MSQDTPKPDDDPIVAERRAKLDALRAKGSPFPNRFVRVDICGDLHQQHEARDRDSLDLNPVVVKVAGRMMVKRVTGRATFATLHDMSGSILLYLTDSYPGKEQHQAFKDYDVGDIIGADGVLFKTQQDELTVRVRSVELLVKALRPPQSARELDDAEQRYRKRYLDLMANEESRLTFVLRSRIIQSLRAFFLDKRFLEVETPMMHETPGGAAARAFETHHNALDMNLYLRAAPELYLKRLVVGGFEKVFEINRSFRNQDMSTVDNPEFTMLEFYVAYRNYSYLMRFIEELMRGIIHEVFGTLKINYQGAEIDFERPFNALPLTEAITQYHPELTAELVNNRDAIVDKLRALDIPFEEQDALGALQVTLFKNTVQPDLRHPTYIFFYPAELCPLARRSDKNADLCERFKLYIAGVEIANGASELNDPEEQAEVFREQARRKEAGDAAAMHYDADYIRALEHGLPPTAGAGIGIDRLVMILTDSPSIRDAILFPQMRAE